MHPKWRHGFFIAAKGLKRAAKGWAQKTCRLAKQEPLT
ncbi:hypothetical protein CHK_1945 [Christensenella hongkongensis]|uniref:Uncharacterized protein n=1 Tax=Christensenella hongkongensis TaxID=270498 RepID=A0A0M2NI66_9FIRM|nr:hypothetical protein CHK_1945 [Christensenella hongkongensis]